MNLAPEIIALLMLVAFVAGFVDAIAGGGGLLVIPALMAAGVPPVSALATNKLQSTCGTGGAVITFAWKGRIDLGKFLVPVLAAFTGSAAGAYVLQRIDPSFLAAFIPILLIAMALYFLAAPRLSEEDRRSRLGISALVAMAAIMGFYDGFFGPGAGSILTTALIALFGFGVVSAIAHTKLLNFSSNLAGLIVLMAGGHVLWGVGIPMAAASVAGNQAGAHAAMRFGPRAVRPLIVAMCIGLTVKLLTEPGNPLRTMIG